MIADERQSAPATLRLALIFDASGSMYEEDGTGMSRLSRVQRATKSGLRRLKQESIVAVVGFAYNARLLLPSTPLTEEARVFEVIDNIDGYDLDAGGSGLHEAFQLAFDELLKVAPPGDRLRAVAFTDGLCAGEPGCYEVAEGAAQRNCYLSVIGVGPAAAQSFLRRFGEVRSARWYHVVATDAFAIDRAIDREFSALTCV